MKLISIVAPFLVGQLLASWSFYPMEVLTIVAIGCVCFGYCLFARSRSLIPIAVLFFGIVSVFNVHEDIKKYSVLSSERFLLTVNATPQRPKPNALTMTVSVEEVLSRKGERFISIEHALRGKKLLCQAPEVPWKNISGAQKDDVLLADIRVRSLRPIRSPFSFESNLRRKGVAAQCTIKNAVIVRKATTEKGGYERLVAWMSGYPGYELEGGLFASLLFGYRTALSNILEDQFKRTGLSHLLVFSGAQVAILFVVLEWVLNLIVASTLYLLRLYRGIVVSRLIALALTFFFVLSIGSDKTTVRALIAATVSITAVQLERRSSVLWGMVLSALVLSLLWPGCLIEPGMQLTFAALFGIWLGLLKRSFLWGCFYTSLATSCISVLWFGSFSIVGFLINPIIVPIVSFGTTILGLPALGASILHIPFGKECLEWVFFSLTYLERSVYYLSLFEWSSYVLPPWQAQLVGSGGICVLIFEALRLKRRVVRLKG